MTLGAWLSTLIISASAVSSTQTGHVPLTIFDSQASQAPLSCLTPFHTNPFPWVMRGRPNGKNSTLHFAIAHPLLRHKTHSSPTQCSVPSLKLVSPILQVVAVTGRLLKSEPSHLAALVLRGRAYFYLFGGWHSQKVAKVMKQSRVQGLADFYAHNHIL